MELTLLQRANGAEQAAESDEFRIISEAALAVFGWQDERYKLVLRLLEAGASLDAAMTLVPEGLHLTHSGEGRFLERGRFVASVEGWATERDDEGQEIFTTPLRRHGVAQTFALALCAAALRARAATPSSNTQEIEP